MIDPRRTFVPMKHLLGFAFWLVAGCQSPAVESEGAACTYGQTIACFPADGCAGVRTCTPDLIGFGPCACFDAGVSDASARDAARGSR